MKNRIKPALLLMLCVCIDLSSQESKVEILASMDKNVFLFFPSPITKAIPGNGDFQFGYNTETAETFGILKAIAPKGESTLHVITEDQAVYSFMVKSAETLTKFEYFFDGSEAVGNIDRSPGEQKPAEKGIEDDVVIGQKITEDDYVPFRRKFDQGSFEFCQKLVAGGEFYKNIYRTKSNVVLKLANIAYRNDKTYIMVSIDNKSTVDYDLNFIQFNKIAKKASKKSNYQAIEIKRLAQYTYQGFDRIEALSSHTAVYVFDKLSIDKNKLINIEINERHGERNIELPVEHRLINNPNSKF